MNILQSILLLYFLVAVNFLFNKMKDFSCHVQTIVKENLYAKHGLNIIAVFFLLVLFTRNSPLHPLILVSTTFVMYMFFMLITKCEFKFLCGFLVCMTVVFYLEANKLYKLSKKPANAEEIKKRHEQFQLLIQVISVALVLVGVLVYIGQHSREFKKNWDWNKFWIGVSKCSENGSDASKGFLKDIGDGVRRLVK